MILPLQFRRAAQKEFDEATIWYEQRRIGLGVEFIAEVEKTFDQINTQPNRFPVVLSDVREARVWQFPYCIYYRIKTDRIVILAVFHSSRDPMIWQSRT